MTAHFDDGKIQEFFFREEELLLFDKREVVLKNPSYACGRGWCFVLRGRRFGMNVSTCAEVETSIHRADWDLACSKSISGMN